jgi:hypothetical protein
MSERLRLSVQGYFNMKSLVPVCYTILLHYTGKDGVGGGARDGDDRRYITGFGVGIEESLICGAGCFVDGIV